MRNKTFFATGSDVRNKFIFAKERSIYPGPDLEDLSKKDNYEKFKRQSRLNAKKLDFKPDIVICDLHPGYYSTRFAKEKQSWFHKDYQLLRVQQHHAHIASVMHETRMKGPVIGVAFTGGGYGTDGKVWGGEFLLVGRSIFQRLVHMKYLNMPGGDRTIRAPWRLVLSILGKDGIPLLGDIENKDKQRVLSIMEKNPYPALTSSVGKLFEAAAALLGVCVKARYEAEGLMRMESLCDEAEKGSYGFEVIKENDQHVIDIVGLFKEMAADVKRNEKIEIISAKFHNTIVNIVEKTVKRLSKQAGIKDVALSGSVFQNRILFAKVMEKLYRSGFSVYTNSKFPMNELNVAFGQFYVARSAIKS